jgi:hypothetical protein
MRRPLLPLALRRAKRRRNLGRAPTYTLNRNGLVDQPGGERAVAETLGRRQGAQSASSVAQSLLPANPEARVPAGSRRAPIDAGLANASDTTHISDVLDSHPILSDLTSGNRVLRDERSPRNRYGLGVESRFVAGG